MEIKTDEASIKTQTSSETDSESEISLEKIAKKKKNKETQHSETVMYFHYYTEILYDKPLSLKQSGVPVQEKGKNVLHDQEMYRRDLPVSPSIAYHATAHDGGPSQSITQNYKPRGNSASFPTLSNGAAGYLI